MSFLTQFKPYNEYLIESIKCGYNAIYESLDYRGSEVGDKLLKKYNIADDAMWYLGSGEYGSAYDMGNGMVFKITSSKSEYEFAKLRMEGVYSNIAKIYDAEENRDGRTYIIILEKLDTESDNIDEMWYTLESAMDEHGLSMSEVGSISESDLDIDDDIKKFMTDLYGIGLDYRNIGIMYPDIQPNNIGRASDGTFKAFDLDER